MKPIKSARRQAYRYGQQVRWLRDNVSGDLSPNSAVMESIERVQDAFKMFIAQFDTVDHEVIKNWLEDEYRRGVEGKNPLTVLTP